MNITAREARKQSYENSQAKKLVNMLEVAIKEEVACGELETYLLLRYSDYEMRDIDLAVEELHRNKFQVEREDYYCNEEFTILTIKW